jgi:serine/tyrosine/threonine adenylyltransferase
MRSVNPAFYDAFHELNNVLARPFEDSPSLRGMRSRPAPHEEVLQTFCGT